MLYAVGVPGLHRQNLDGSWTQLTFSGVGMRWSGGTLMTFGTSQLRLSHDGGDTWQTTPYPNEPGASSLSVVHHGDVIYIVADEQVWASDDAGASWTTSMTPFAVSDALTSPEGHLLVIGDWSARTRDLGQTWEWEHGLQDIFPVRAAVGADGQMMIADWTGVRRLIKQ